MGYTMSASELAFWQDRAALLDPDAYEFVQGHGETRTVPGGENWYCLAAWFVQASGGGLSFFARQNHIDAARPLPEGTTLTIDASVDGIMYLCKPSLVVSGDARYTDDPRALYFDRIHRMQSELPQYEIGATDSGNGGATAALPNDFTDGLIIYASLQDVAWASLMQPGGDGAYGGLNEISDTDRVRFAEPNLLPFKRTVSPDFHVRGATQAGGRATFVYLKLDGTGW